MNQISDSIIVALNINIESIADYDIVADIRPNEFGRQNLHYNGHKLYCHSRGVTKQRWLCRKRTVLNKCRAAIHTMDVNGIVMMKVHHADHTHQP